MAQPSTAPAQPARNITQTDPNPINSTTGDQWTTFATNFTHLATIVGRAPIAAMLTHAHALRPFSTATAILDIGSGPGPVMDKIIADHDVRDAALTCADFSQGMIEAVEQKRAERVQADGESAWGRVKTVVLDATDLGGVGEGSLSHVTAGWVFFMTPDPPKCLREARRVLEEGGVLVHSSWQGSQWIDLAQLYTRIVPGVAPMRIAAGFDGVEGMEAGMKEAGFRDVEAFEVPTYIDYESLEQFLEVIRGIPAMREVLKGFSEEQMESYRMLMYEEGKKICADEPGRMTGVALVAVGRK